MGFASIMSDVATWSVRELKRYLQINGVSTRGYAEKNDLIDLATSLLYESEQAEMIKNVITLIVIIVTVLLLNVFMRSKIEKLFWLNPKWVGSWMLLNCIKIIEKLLTLNIILSWILPPTLQQYNYIDVYLVKSTQPFPIMVPLNYDTQTQDASMWIDLYPMMLIYLMRTFKDYFSLHYHYFWYSQYRRGYYQKLNNAENTVSNQEDDYEAQREFMNHLNEIFGENNVRYIGTIDENKDNLHEMNESAENKEIEYHDNDDDEDSHDHLD